ncbi:MAG: hypothetical protein D6748_14200 [Calditrichaeota bacterium]|nr:MAG: hypothetical protein D6748_14200 [Calditrichota bacterium]
MNTNQRTIIFGLILFMLGGLSVPGRVSAQVSKGHKISLNFRNTNIYDVFKTLATEGGINIVTSKSVQGTVSISVENVDVMEALDLIVEMQGLAYYKDDGIIKVVTAEEYKERFGREFKDTMKTRVVQLIYANSEEIVKSLFQLKSKDGNVIADKRSNSIIMVDLPAKIRVMEAVLRKLDIPVQTRSFVLNYISVQSVENVVKNMLSAGGKVQLDPTTNQILVIDNPERVERIGQFLEDADQPTVGAMRVFTLQYANAEAVASKIQSELTPGIGSVSFDANTNKLFVRDLPDNLTFISQLVDTLDQKTRQVLIEAKILQITLNDNFKLGVDWNAITNQLSGTVEIGSQFRILSETDPGGNIKATGLVSGDYTFNALLEALRDIGKTELLSNPRIMCIDGEEAHILVGSTVPYKTVDTRDVQGVFTTFEKVVTVEVGVKLNVTPIINEDGFITMKIRPEVSEVTSFIDNIPVVDKSETETTVIVKNGVTIVIGGLIKDQKIVTEKRVPILGSIPILGIPFRSTSKRISKTELVILLRPQIISGEENMEISELGNKHKKETGGGDTSR